MRDYYLPIILTIVFLVLLLITFSNGDSSKKEPRTYYKFVREICIEKIDSPLCVKFKEPINIKVMRKDNKLILQSDKSAVYQLN